MGMTTNLRPAERAREWELDGQLHRTADDARRQILRSKVGAHVAASDDYLRALRVDLWVWLREIDAELELRAEHDRANGCEWCGESPRPNDGSCCAEET